MKLQINFQVRDLLNSGDAFLERYLNNVFNFTQISYKSTSLSVLFHSSRLNHLWHRIFLESMGLALPIKDYLNNILRKVCEEYLDGNLAMKAN